jgi:hypothetical protein
MQKSNYQYLEYTIYYKYLEYTIFIKNSRYRSNSSLLPMAATKKGDRYMKEAVEAALGFGGGGRSVKTTFVSCALTDDRLVKPETKLCRQ